MTTTSLPRLTADQREAVGRFALAHAQVAIRQQKVAEAKAALSGATGSRLASALAWLDLQRTILEQVQGDLDEAEAAIVEAIR